MIHILYKEENLFRTTHVKPNELKDKMKTLKWFWIDYNQPTKEEAETLKTCFDFPKLAVEDCLYTFQRPKIDFHHEYMFVIVHGIHEKVLDLQEYNFFMGKNWIISYHKEHCKPIRDLFYFIGQFEEGQSLEIPNLFIDLLDQFVDMYFSHVFRIEDAVNDIEIHINADNVEETLGELLTIRSDIARIRRSITAMKELVYELLNNKGIHWLIDELPVKLESIYDHLIFLSDAIEDSLRFTSDIRENYLSLNTHNLNNTMKTLTVITTIFMPLSFLVGLYGMNFKYMPEIGYRYSYPILWIIMILVTLIMVLWFKRKKWF